MYIQPVNRATKEIQFQARAMPSLEGTWYRRDGTNVGEIQGSKFIWHMDWTVQGLSQLSFPTDSQICRLKLQVSRCRG